MERSVIQQFVDPGSGRIFRSAIVFSAGDNVLLFEKKGHMLLTDTAYASILKSGAIPADLLRKLNSRGFLSGQTKTPGCTEACQIRPEFFMIDLTNKCNMRCKYCLRNVVGGQESMQQGALRDICAYINAYCEKEKLTDVSIQPWGGEPLLELDSILLMRQLIKPAHTRVHFSIETNGLLLNQENINTLYKNRIGIGISIDGYQAVHDSQRVMPDGAGSHRQVEYNMRLAQHRYGKQLGTITTVTRNNAPHIEKILEYYATQLKLTNVKFNFVHKSMFSNCDGLCLSCKEISSTEIRILEKLIELNECGYSISDYNIRVKLKNLLFRQYSDICHSNGCAGGRKMIVFDMRGDIYPCELTDIPEENIGSIYDGRELIETIRQAMQKSSYFIQKKESTCDECEWYVFCKGGCTVRTISVGNRPPAIDIVECAVNSALYPALVELILTKPQVVNQMLGKGSIVLTV